jgi:hypothetical protein
LSHASRPSLLPIKEHNSRGSRPARFILFRWEALKMRTPKPPLVIPSEATP